MSNFVFYVLINIANVVMQTIKTIVTVKCGRMFASIINALTYALYTVVIYVTATDGLDLLKKCLIVAACNLLGVYVVKTLEEKFKKDRLMRIEVTCYNEVVPDIEKELNDLNIPHIYIENIGRHAIFTIYSETKEQSAAVKELIKKYDCKYFVSKHQTIID